MGFRRKKKPVFASFEAKVANAFLWLFDGKTWRRHPKPFAKNQRGMMRRAERLFVRQFDRIET